MKLLLITAVAIGLPALAAAHSIVLERATIADMRSEMLNNKYKEDTTVIRVDHRVAPMTLFPIPIPFPRPGPVCLSCPPMDFDQQIILPMIQK